MPKVLFIIDIRKKNALFFMRLRAIEDFVLSLLPKFNTTHEY
jgi:hypothetical protein